MPALEGGVIYGIQIRESANDGSDFSNAAADYRIAFLGEDGLWHVKDSAGTVTNPFTGAGTTLTSDRLVKTSDFSTTSATFVDVTGLSLTITTGAHKVLVGFGGSGYNNNLAGSAVLTVNVDGTDQADTTNGIVYDRQLGTASENKNLSFTYMTAALTAASHTFKIRLHRGGAGTATISGAGPACTFWVAEQAT